MRWIKQRVARLTGAKAEQRAKDFLLKRGLQFIGQNYLCKAGEIDLIMRDNEQWVFVEVKYRQTSNHGNAAEFFDSRKATKLKRAIYHYLQSHKLNSEMTAFRIDLVAIDGDTINWHQSVTQ